MDDLLRRKPEICNLLGVTPEKGTCQRHPNIVIYTSTSTSTSTSTTMMQMQKKKEKKSTTTGWSSSSSVSTLSSVHTGGSSTTGALSDKSIIGSTEESTITNSNNMNTTTTTTTTGSGSGSGSSSSSSFLSSSCYKIDCCRICDSETKAGGRKQRKTFANLINDIKGMHETQEWAEYKLMTWGEEEHIVEGVSSFDNNDNNEDNEDNEIEFDIGNNNDNDNNNINDENNNDDDDEELLRISKVGKTTSQQFESWQKQKQKGDDEGGGGENNGKDCLHNNDGEDNNQRQQPQLKLEQQQPKSKSKSKSKQPSMELVLKLQQDQRNILKEEFKKYVEIRDRKKKFKLYKQVFVCSEAVDFMVNNKYASTRMEAVKLGKRLQHKFKIFDHITHKAKKRDFADEYLFFRFFDDEDAASDDDDYYDGDDTDSDYDDDIYDQQEEAAGGGVFGGGGSSQRSTSTAAAAAAAAENDSNRSAITFTQDALEQYAKKFKQYIEVQDLCQDRTYMMKKYKNCFIGKEAVDFMVDQAYAKSRSHAVKLGRALQKRLKLFEHVTQDHDFDDQHWYYRFCDNSGDGEELDIVDESGLFEIVTQETLEDLAKEFKVHADVQDRQFLLKTYPQCFVASEAVDFMCNLGYARSRIEAVKMGKALQNRLKLFEHVTKEHNFNDEYLFFRFCDDDEQNEGTSLLPDVDSSKPKHIRPRKILKKSAKSVATILTGNKPNESDSFKMKQKIEESLSYDKDKEKEKKDNRSGMKVNFVGVSERSDRPMANGPGGGSSANGGLSSQSSIDAAMTVNEEFMVSIAKRAAQVSGWTAKKTISDEELESKEKEQREANELNDKLKRELHQAKEESSKMIFNLEAILQSKDTTIDELEAKIDRQERQIIYELRLIAATKRAMAKQEKEQFGGGVAADSNRSIQLQDPNDIAATQVDKARFDLASAQEMASQKEATLKATIQVQSAALTELQLKYDKQQYELEEVQKKLASQGESFEGTSYSTAAHTSNANLVNQLEKLKRDRKSAKEESAKKEKELLSLIEEHVQQKDIYKAKCQTLQKELDGNKKKVESNIVQDLRILAKAKSRKQKGQQQQI